MISYFFGVKLKFRRLSVFMTLTNSDSFPMSATHYSYVICCEIARCYTLPWRPKTEVQKDDYKMFEPREPTKLISFGLYMIQKKRIWPLIFIFYPRVDLIYPRQCWSLLVCSFQQTLFSLFIKQHGKYSLGKEWKCYFLNQSFIGGTQGRKLVFGSLYSEDYTKPQLGVVQIFLLKFFL